MTPDQISRLNDLQGRLVETVINDADPLNWSASGLLLSEMDTQQRGDAKWCRSVAVQSVSLLIRVQQLLEPKAGSGGGDDHDPEADIKRAERAAADMLARVGTKASAEKR